MNLRQKIIKASYDAKACHIGSALSCVEIMEAIEETKEDAEFIFSKASGVATYYCMKHPLKKATELLRSYPLPSKEGGLVWSGGSLGQGLSVACGIALTGKRVYVLMSDGELQEGQTWEAIMFANHHKLPLTVVVDRNRLQALGDTEKINKLEPLEEKFAAFGWNTRSIDGHNKRMLTEALKVKLKKPRVIIANTIKGKGVDFIENKYEWHYKNLDENGYKKAMVQLNTK